VSELRITTLRAGVLRALSDRGCGPECSGGCNIGWDEFFEGAELRAAWSLAKASLLEAANGTRADRTAFHVNDRGRAALAAHLLVVEG